MRLQTLKIGGREFILLPERDYQRLAAQARRQSEGDYRTEATVAAAGARYKKDKPIPFEEVERELYGRSRSGRLRKRTDIRRLRGKGLID